MCHTLSTAFVIPIAMLLAVCVSLRASLILCVMIVRTSDFDQADINPYFSSQKRLFLSKYSTNFMWIKESKILLVLLRRLMDLY